MWSRFAFQNTKFTVNRLIGGGAYYSKVFLIISMPQLMWKFIAFFSVSFMMHGEIAATKRGDHAQGDLRATVRFWMYYFRQGNSFTNASHSIKLSDSCAHSTANIS